jgi:hypothetical protein
MVILLKGVPNRLILPISIEEWRIERILIVTILILVVERVGERLLMLLPWRTFNNGDHFILSIVAYALLLTEKLLNWIACRRALE